MAAGSFVKHKSKNDVFKIFKIKTDVSLIHVDAEGKKMKAGSEESLAKSVSRADLLLAYVPHKISKKERLEKVEDPCKHLEVVTYLVRGAVLKELTSLMSKSSENDVELMMAPERAAITSKAFGAGQLKLVAFSHLIHLIPTEKDLASNALCLGKITEPINAHIVLRSANVYDESKLFVSKFFRVFVNCVKDARESNCELQWNEFTIKIDKTRDLKVKLPVCVNNIKLAKGTVIKLLSADKVVEQVPASKRARKS